MFVSMLVFIMEALMGTLVLLLIFLPFILSLAIFFSKDNYEKPISIGGAIFLAILSISAWQNFGEPIFLHLPLDIFIIVADFVLLGYFLIQGYKKDSLPVSLLALLQIVMFIYFLFIAPSVDVGDIYVDSLSTIMYLLINIVGGLIVIYAVGYIEDESSDKKKQKYFLSLLMAFLGVMNFLVSVNNIEWFFFLFEVTTLASYLLIRFRGDSISIENSLRALWMNQIGGVAILVFLIGASYEYGTIHFTELLKLDFATLGLLPVAFLAIAALIKGAMIPFDKWLLGAMVAPTPVSAILHSATMVKIAPFLIIKLSVIISGTYLGFAISFIGGVVFVLAAAYALSKSYFKEILAYSTISLLGLMIMLGAIGTNLALSAALMLIVFHGISKALLFMEAGILEKLFGAKTIDKYGELIQKAPINAMLIALGFISVTLPPFGAFLAKWLALESISFGLKDSIFSSLFLVFTIVGSVIFMLLYFRVLGAILSKRGEDVGFRVERYKNTYKFSTYALGAILLFSSINIAPLSEHLFSQTASALLGEEKILLSSGLSFVLPFTNISFWYILLSFALMLSPLLLYFFHINEIDRTKEYQGGERMELNFNSYFFDIEGAIGKRTTQAMILCFIAVMVAGGLS